MDKVLFDYPELLRANFMKHDQNFSIIINNESITSSLNKSIMSSNKVCDVLHLDSTSTSLALTLNLLCNDTLQIISNLFKNGKTVFENDRNHNRDIFEIGRAIGNEKMIKIFSDFVNSYPEITIQNFYDFYDIATVQNDTLKMNECITFFASKMRFLNTEYIIDTTKIYGYDFLEGVLTSKSLKISTQDSLCKIIISLSMYDIVFFELLKYIKVEFCSKDVIEEISNFAEENKLESVSSQVFKRALLHLPTICQKLEISSINEYHRNDLSNENIRKLMILSKTVENSHKIYYILEKASNEEDLSTIKFAVEKKYSDVYDTYGYNMILLAASKDNLGLVKQLFYYGADMKSKSKFNRTVLHWFCIKGNLEGVKFAHHFININAMDTWKYTPLHEAVYHENYYVCAYLCSKPTIDKYAKNDENKTPLAVAKDCKCRCIEVLLRGKGFPE